MLHVSIILYLVAFIWAKFFEMPNNWSGSVAYEFFYFFYICDTLFAKL